jgi:hypothetical protein
MLLGTCVTGKNDLFSLDTTYKEVLGLIFVTNL